MTSVSYTTLLTNWFRVHVPFSQKSNITSVARTGYAAAYPEIKRCHRRKPNLLSCIPFVYRSKEKNYQPKFRHNNSSIKGCASFARFDRYQEGDTEEDC